MQKSKKVFKIKYSYILFILFIFILPPPFLNEIPYYPFFNNLITTLIVFVLILLNIYKQRINMFIMITLMFVCWNVLSSYILAEGILDIFNNIKIVSIVLLINLFINNHLISLLKSLNWLFSIYIYLNFITILLFPNGLYMDNPRTDHYRSAWLLGIENQFVYTIVPGITIIILYTFYKKNKLDFNSVIALLVSIITILSSWSATAIVSYVLFILGLVFLLTKGTKKLLNYNLLIILYSFIWIVVVRINSYNFFQNIIENILDKDMTFSNRTVIWDRAFLMIESSAWYGYGNNSVIELITKDFRTHNLILQMLLDNGLVSLILFILLLSLIGQQLIKYNANTNVMISIIVIGMFAFLIGGLAESYQLNHLFLIMILLYNCKYIILYKNETSNNKIFGGSYVK